MFFMTSQRADLPFEHTLPKFKSKQIMNTKNYWLFFFYISEAFINVLLLETTVDDGEGL